jgi:hypothetical protein
MNEKAYKNLISLLKLFKNRPYHLAKYLVENSAFSDEFLRTISQSVSLEEISDDKDQKNLPVLFTDIQKMNDYFSSLIDLKSLENKSAEELSILLNNRLDEYIMNEKYEDAASLRDYMFSKGIKRKK